MSTLTFRTDQSDEPLAIPFLRVSIQGCKAIS